MVEIKINGQQLFLDSCYNTTDLAKKYNESIEPNVWKMLEKLKVKNKISSYNIVVEYIAVEDVFKFFHEYPRAKMARHLGVNESTIYRWLLNFNMIPLKYLKFMQVMFSNNNYYESR